VVPEPPAPTPTAPLREIPAGLLAFSGSSDQSVGVWDLKSGASQSYLRGHTGEVQALALAADESFVASGGADKVIRLWNGSDGTAGKTFPVEGAVNTLLFSADAKTLYAGLEQTWAVLAIDLASGLVKKLEAHTGGVVALALGADGTLWSAGRDRSLRSWDLEQGKPLALKVDLPAEPLAMAMAADGQRLFVTGKEAVLRAFSPQDGKELGQAALTQPLAAAVVACPTRGVVFVSGEGQVLVFDGATLAPKGALAVPEASKASAKALLCLALSKDGAWLAAGDGGNGLWLWDTATSEVRWTKAGAHTGQVNALVLTPDVGAPAPPPAPEAVAPGSGPGPAPAPLPDPKSPADPGASSEPGAGGK
jgi:WD40 repeat protein